MSYLLSGGLVVQPPIGTFKSSTAKKDGALKYCATNLHVQVRPEPSWN